MRSKIETLDVSDIKGLVNPFMTPIYDKLRYVDAGYPQGGHRAASGNRRPLKIIDLILDSVH